MKTVRVCMLLKNVTLKTPSVISVVIGKLNRMIVIPIELRKNDCKWNTQ